MIEERRCADLDRQETMGGLTLWEILLLTFATLGVHQTLQSLGFNIFLIALVDVVVDYMLLQLMRYLAEKVPPGFLTDLVYWVAEPLQYHVRNDPQTLPPVIR